MKLTHLLFVLAIFSFAACGDDDTASDSNVLSYDGANASAPELDAGIHVLAVRFPASDLQGRIGKKLHEVEVFVDSGADSYKIVIYGQNSSSQPGDILQEVNFTNQVTGNKWAIVDVDPIEITGEDLWIGVEVVHSQPLQTIGCDAGPRQNDGDWIWGSNEGSVWETFQGRTGTESVNWNIKGNLQD